MIHPSFAPALVLLLGAPAAPPSAIVCWIQGSARTVSPSPAPLEPFTRLQAGTVVETAAGAALRLVFANGERYHVGPASSARVARHGLEALRGSIERLAPVPTLAALRPLLSQDEGKRAAAVRFRAQASSAGPTHAPAVVLPDDAVLTLARQDAGPYRVSVENEDGRAVASVASTTGQVRLPRGVLEAGAVYYWHAEPLDGGARLTGILAVLAPEQMRAREDLRRWIADSQEPDLHLLLAELDRTFGLAP